MVMGYISWCKEDVSECKIKGLTVKPSLGSQRDRPAELKSDRQRKWEQKREMKRTTERKREKGRKRESEGEQKTESNWFYDGFQLHGTRPNQLFMTRTHTHTHTHFKSVEHHKHKISVVSDNIC